METSGRACLSEKDLLKFTPAGLDLATATGAAVFVGGRVEWCAERFSVAEEGDEGSLFADFRAWLWAWLMANRVTDLGIEAPLPTAQRKASGDDRTATNMRTMLRAYGLFAIAQEVAASLNIRVYVIYLSQWRSKLGVPASAPKGMKGDERGRWIKAKTVERCRDLGWAVTNDNAADALGVLHALRSMLDPNYAVRATDLFRVLQEASAPATA